MEKPVAPLPTVAQNPPKPLNQSVEFASGEEDMEVEDLDSAYQQPYTPAGLVDVKKKEQKWIIFTKNLIFLKKATQISSFSRQV